MIGILILANDNRVIIMYNTLYMFTISMNLVDSTHTYIHKNTSTLCYAHNILNLLLSRLKLYMKKKLGTSLL